MNKYLKFALIINTGIFGLFLNSCNNIDEPISESPNISLRQATENDPDSLNFNEIINSIEFEEFIKANVKFYSTIQKQDSLLSKPKRLKSAKTGITTDGKLKYKIFPFGFDPKLGENVISKNAALQKKFPSIKKLNFSDVKSLITFAIEKSNRINKILSDNGFITKNKKTRLKNNTEGYIATYCNSQEAFAAAMYYSTSISGAECAGFVLEDGTAVIYISDLNTEKSSLTPPYYSGCINGFSYSVYNGKRIIETFHTHFNTPNTSSVDKNMAISDFGDVPMVILYDNCAYYYQYNNGYNDGTYTKQTFE